MRYRLKSMDHITRRAALNLALAKIKMNHYSIVYNGILLAVTTGNHGNRERRAQNLTQLLRSQVTGYDVPPRDYSIVASRES